MNQTQGVHELKAALHLTPFGDGLLTLIEAVQALGVLILGWLALPLDMYLRWDFGERALTPLRMILASMAMGVPTMMVALGLDLQGEIVRIGPWGLFVLLFWLLGGIHLLRILWRNWKHIGWYSYSSGVSHFSRLAVIDLSGLKSLLGLPSWVPNKPFLWLSNEWIVALLVEPLVGFFLIVPVLTNYDPYVGGILKVVMWAFVMRNLMQYGSYRNQVLDLRDANLVQAYLYDASIHRPKWEQGGFSVITLPPPNVEEMTEKFRSFDIRTPLGSEVKSPGSM